MPQNVIVQFDKEALNFLMKSFHFVLQNPKIIDWSNPAFPSKNDLNSICNKLLPYKNTTKKDMSLELTAAEFIDLTSAIYCASYSVKDNNDRALLERIHSYCSDMDDQSEGTLLRKVLLKMFMEGK